MFISGTLKTKFVFRRKSASIRSPVDINPVVESNSPIFDDATSPPSSSKARKLRILSNLTFFKQTPLASVFKKAIQTPVTVSPCTTSAVLDPLRHIPTVSEDGFFHPAMPSPTGHQERGIDFGLISSAVDDASNQEDINPDPPGSRIATRVTSLRMRTAAVWASIPATMEGLPASCVSSEASTPVKSQVNSLEHDETASVESATVDSPLFSTPATSATAVSDWGPRDSLGNLSMIGHKQERIRVMPKVLPALDVISLAQPTEFPGLARVKPPSECRRNDEEKFNYTPNSPVSGCESSPASSSSEQRAGLRVARLWTPLLRVLEQLLLMYRPLRRVPSLLSNPFPGYRSCSFSRIRTKTPRRPASKVLLLCSRDRPQWRCLFAHGHAQRSRVPKLSERLVRRCCTRRASLLVSLASWKLVLEIISLSLPRGRNAHPELHKNFPHHCYLCFPFSSSSSFHHLRLMRSGAIIVPVYDT
ncbi:hypothetical protein DFH29DRAFT_292812 [Suillus ampliporus]|nr:hypothetical protein DFH29DRAFT_292812 [Suillus ampliporus]